MLIDTIDKWRKIKTNDLILAEDLKKSDELLFESFSNEMYFEESGIETFMGAGVDKINIHTVNCFVKAYTKVIPKINANKVLVIFDDRENSKLFSDSAVNILLSAGVEVFMFNKSILHSSKFLKFIKRNYGLDYCLFFGSENNDPNINGVKIIDFFDGNTKRYDFEELKRIYKKLDTLEEHASSDKAPTILGDNLFTRFVNDATGDMLLGDDKLDVNVVGSIRDKNERILLSSLFNGLGVKNSLINNGKYSGKKDLYNLDNVSSYKKVIKLARKEKADLAFVTDWNTEKTGFILKYKRRYKYINGNQIAALYLDYKLSRMHLAGKIGKQSYIIKTRTSGNLPLKIAGKYSVDVIEVDNFKEFHKKEFISDENLLFAYDEDFNMFQNSAVIEDGAAIQSIVAVAEMVSYHNSVGVNSYEHLKSLWAEFGIHRTVKNSMNMDLDVSKRLMKNILKVKEVNSIKVIKKIDSRFNNNHSFTKDSYVKLMLSDGSWISINRSSKENVTDIFIQTIGKPGQDIIDVVVFEKEIESMIQENSESYPEKKISKKTIMKYLIFLSIMIVTLYLVFTLIYDGSKTNGDTFSVAKDIFASNSRWIFLIGFIAYFFPVFLHAFQKKRLIGALGQSVKWRHLAISAFMGSFISWITPFAIGGDGVGYWFLRRKGFKRGPLASSFLMGTIIYQFQIVIVSAILLPMGIVMFHDQIFNGSAEMRVIITLFIIGACWNLFATFMIYMLTFNKRFQEWIVRTTIKLLEWLPFVHIQDPGRLAATHQFTFFEIRNGMKLLWKRKILLLECTFYELITSFINFYIFIPMLLGVILPGLQYGSYFSPIVAGDIIGTANSYSITPGGSGTGEFISMTVNGNIYKGVGNSNSSATATALDFLQKITIQWPILIGSMISIIVVILGEKRVKKYKKINKNNKLKEILTNHSTTFYKKVSIPIILIVISFLLTFFLIF